MNVRSPNLINGTAEEQIGQIKSYLFQLSQELNYAYGEIDKQISEFKPSPSVKGLNAKAVNNNNALERFNEVKSLIIKSADIVDAYYDKMDLRFSGYYLAQSDFGSYSQATDNQIAINSSGIQSLLTDIQKLDTELNGIGEFYTEAYGVIKAGKVDEDAYGMPIYGVEIGQRNIVGGVETFNKFARFTSDRLSFYDAGGSEVAYFSDSKLYISDAEIVNSLKMGGYKWVVKNNGGVTLVWEGV